MYLRVRCADLMRRSALLCVLCMCGTVQARDELGMTGDLSWLKHIACRVACTTDNGLMRSCISWNPFAQGTANGALGLMGQAVEGLASSLISSAVDSMCFEAVSVSVPSSFETQGSVLWNGLTDKQLHQWHEQPWGEWHGRVSAHHVKKKLQTCKSDLFLFQKQLRKQKAIVQQKDAAQLQATTQLQEKLGDLGKQLDNVRQQKETCGALLNAQLQATTKLQEELGDLRKQLHNVRQQNETCGALLQASEAQKKKQQLLQAVLQKMCWQPAAFADQQAGFFAYENSTACHVVVLIFLSFVCWRQARSPSAEERSNEVMHSLLGGLIPSKQIVDFMQAMRTTQREEAACVRYVQNRLSSSDAHSAAPQRVTLYHFFAASLHELKMAYQANNIEDNTLMMLVKSTGRMWEKHQTDLALRCVKRFWSRNTPAPLKMSEAFDFWAEKCLREGWQGRRNSIWASLSPTILGVFQQIKRGLVGSVVPVTALQLATSSSSVTSHVEEPQNTGNMPLSWSYLGQDVRPAPYSFADIGLLQLHSWNAMQQGDLLAAAVGAADGTAPAAVPLAAVAPAAPTPALFVFAQPSAGVAPPAAVPPEAEPPDAVAPAAAAPRWMQLFDARWCFQPSTQPSAAERQSWASTAAAQEKERSARGAPSRQKRVPGTKHTGRRCKDKTLDMRCAENQGLDKYKD